MAEAADEGSSDRAECVVVTICNQKGLHARASAKFVKFTQEFQSSISVSKDGETVDGGSILDLMMLAAGPGTVIEISASGPDQKAAIAELTALVECGFEENDAE